MIFPIVLCRNHHVSSLHKALKDQNGKVEGAYCPQKAQNCSFKICLKKVCVYYFVYKISEGEAQRFFSSSFIIAVSKASNASNVSVSSKIMPQVNGNVDVDVDVDVVRDVHCSQAKKLKRSGQSWG